MRCFVAVMLDAVLQGEIASATEPLRRTGADVKWVERENLHFTLKFLGEVPRVRIAVASEAIARALAGRERFSIRLAGIGTFPPRGRPRVIWLGLAHGCEPLAGLVACLEGEMERSGFPRDTRGFNPHLTLGRVRSDAGAVALAGAVDYVRTIEFRPAEVDSVCLMMSTLTPAGPRYTVVRGWELG